MQVLRAGERHSNAEVAVHWIRGDRFSVVTLVPSTRRRVPGAACLISISYSCSAYCWE